MAHTIRQKNRKPVLDRRGADCNAAWRKRGSIVVAVLCGIGLVIVIFLQLKAKGVDDFSLSKTVEHPPSLETAPLHSQSLSDSEIRTAANQLFGAINPARPENRYFTQFAKDKLFWIIRQKQAGSLSLILLKNVDSAGLIADDLMASGRPEGKPVIVISQPSFFDFLLDGGRVSTPFSQEQRNDFAIGLIHEVVHLENPNLPNLTTPQERLQEEVRAWRAVDLNVVRQFRQMHQPMNRRLIEADDAIRSCEDSIQCDRLVEILRPSYGFGAH